MEGFTAESLAELVGMKATQIAKLESDAMLPPVAGIIRLARVLSVGPSPRSSCPTRPRPGGASGPAATRTAEYAYENLTPGDQRDRHLMAFRVVIEPAVRPQAGGLPARGRGIHLRPLGPAQAQGRRARPRCSPRARRSGSTRRSSHQLTNPGKEADRAAGRALHPRGRRCLSL
ncbi:MAG: helix-turn-helix transcriptional regulator [Anaerotruncus sp.]|nr:helix-turn-helix transcriptional regulator [Anaerotruncus sp.]